MEKGKNHSLFRPEGGRSPLKSSRHRSTERIRMLQRAASVFFSSTRAARVARHLSFRAFASQSCSGGQRQQEQQNQRRSYYALVGTATALAFGTAAAGANGHHPLNDSELFDFVSHCDAQSVPSAATSEKIPAPAAMAPLSSSHLSSGKKPMSRRKLARRNSTRKQKRHYQYVIVGAGTTTYAAIEAIRAVDTDADILIISDQSKLPRIDIDSSEDDQLLECDALADTYNEWRRHVNSRLENEPDAYSTSAVRVLSFYPQYLLFHHHLYSMFCFSVHYNIDV